MLGLSRTNLNFSGSGVLPHVTLAEFSTSNAPVFGGFLNVYFSGNFKRFGLFNEVLYTSYDTNAQYTDTRSSVLEVEHNSTVSFSYINIHTLFGYKLPISKTNVVILFGLSNAYAVKADTERIETTRFNDETTTLTKDVIPFIRKYEQGLVFGTNIGLGKINLALKYKLGTGIEDAIAFNSSTASFLVTLGYRL